MKSILNITIALFFGCSSYAQQAIVAVGGNGSSSSGSFSYSVGQIDFTYTQAPSGSMSLGIQQPIVTVSGSQVALKFFIEGYYEGNNLMKSVKNNQDLISPLTDVTDVVVELRDANNASVIIATTTATLKTNGDANCTFTSVPNGVYYIAIKTNNTITTYSATPVSVGSTPLIYDFSNSVNKAFANNMALVDNGVYAFFSGDINADDNIDNSDYSIWETDANNFEFGIFTTDLNGDGNVDNSDYSIWEANANNFVYSIMP